MPKHMVSLKYGPVSISDDLRKMVPIATPGLTILKGNHPLRPLSDIETVKKSLAILSQAKEGQVVSYGPLYYKREMFWNNIELAGTLIAWCQVIGELLYAKSKRSLTEWDTARLKRLRLFVLAELSLIFPEKQITLPEE